MDERTRLFLCVLASAGFFSVLGGLFGALAGVVTWRDGRAAGTSLGMSVARAFARVSEQSMSPGTLAAIVGGTDGAIFGAFLGCVFGLVAGWHGQAEWQTLRPILLGSMLLVGAAILFGLMAVGLTAAGTRCLLGLFIGGVAGAFDGFQIGQTDGLILGMFAGGVSGTILFLVVFRPRRKKAAAEDQEPR
jgi:hypothetical protein